MNYSINTFTLLGLILAIGIVVDDAIIVLENAYRHQEELGKDPADRRHRWHEGNHDGRHCDDDRATGRVLAAVVPDGDHGPPVQRIRSCRRRLGAHLGSRGA
jgi:Cu/Ag efflux pump CusA